jgi:hypothetical protein
MGEGNVGALLVFGDRSEHTKEKVAGPTTAIWKLPVFRSRPDKLRQRLNESRGSP